MHNITKIYDLLARRVANAPTAEAVIDGSLRLTNAALGERVNAIAKGLIAAGVVRGDRVATLAPPSADFWQLFMATTSIGGIWQGLNPRYQKNEYAYLLEDARPTVVFARAEFDGRAYLQELSALAPAGMRLMPLDETPLGLNSAIARLGSAVSDAELARARAAVDPEDAAVVVYTSGTTGQPKGALLSHRAIVQTALANVAWMGAENLSCTVCPAPINHVGALDNVCMNVFAAGGRIVFFPRVDLAELERINAREQPVYLVGSPTAFAMMLARPGADLSRLSYVKLIVFGGAATPLGDLQKVARSGALLSSVYGQTETTGIVTHTALGASLETMADTIGTALAGNAARIADEAGAEKPVGETGEIQIKGNAVMSGYLNKPEATREAFTPDGWLRTGDLGYQRADGNIVFAGRLKEMFKSGGYNVYPVEVELAICEHPDVAQAAVIAVAHPTFQEVGHGFILPIAGASVSTDTLKAFLRERIADYKIPKSWTVLSEFPFLPNGKVNKRALAATLSVN